MEVRGVPADAPHTAGTRFGSYRIERLIGAGGMGSVYEAQHVGLKKRVALKILHSGYANNDEVVARFLREGEATSRINHPHVVNVTDLGVKDGIPFLVMELLVGESLAELLAREPIITVQRAVDILLPIISAVGMAHDEGVVHRDLKPDNIFLAKNRLGITEAKLLDFGISKMVTRSELTTAASVLGTPHYLSPEQAMALRDIDGRADQYSLAVILYRAVTGALPIGGGDVVLDVLIAVAQGRVRPPRVVRPELPEALERVIMRGLATQPKDRYPHTHLMGADLLPFASDEGRAVWRGYFSARLGELGGEAKTQILTAATVSDIVERAAAAAAPAPSFASPPMYAAPPSAPPIPVATPIVPPGGAGAGALPMGAMPSGAMGAMPSGAMGAMPSGAMGAMPAVASGPPAPLPGGARPPPPGATPRPGPSAPPLGVPVVPPGGRVTSPSVSFAPPPMAPGPRKVPPSASVPIGAPSPRPRPLSEPELTDSGAGLAVEDRERLHGARVSATALIGALVLAAGAVGGVLLWSSSNAAPVAIPASTPRPVATYRVHLTTEPPSASLSLDGVSQGRAPLSIELPADGREHQLEVSADGYRTERLTFREGAVPPDVVRLQKLP